MRISPHHLFTTEITFTLILFLLKDTVIAQQEGASVSSGSNVGGKSYNCDPNTCQVSKDCLCASKNPPNNLLPQDTPQFVTITFDDSVQPTLIETAYDLLNVTFASMQYTDFSLVQEWYSAGHEVADHTFTHVGNPSESEITSCRTMLNSYSGIPNGKIQGFRAPFLNFTSSTLNSLKKLGFTYDSSASAIPDDAYWPYTLDHGMANNCWSGICDIQIPGLWEIPMYAVPDATGIPQLMDVYMAGSPEDVSKWSTAAFDNHYNGGRQPFGIYIHPTHLTAYPGLPDPKPKLDGLISFIKSIASKQDVWFVTNQQLLQWMKNPVKVSELKDQDYLKCQQPVINKEICNGLDDNGNGQIDEELTNNCNFGATTFKTCFNCPGTAPTLDNPTPASSVQNGTAGYRYPIPDNCDTQWWDPVQNTCLCTSSDCQYKDTALPFSTTGSGGKDGSESSASVSSIAQSTAYIALATSMYAWL
ncbi:hypothetical protein BDA99DRAFT_584269 [Phascolomyces articulosus]|uniref:NodB homology domain-containing protein n=1 Tax=Phascolomyces articulosus TaxID=60185 RepID=A0AAD5KAN4_9FUNG|nr:hypothetical protein BDA99DRAFT_584269 [Phascolomyces articulosus]